MRTQKGQRKTGSTEKECEAESIGINVENHKKGNPTKNCGIHHKFLQKHLQTVTQVL